MEKLVPHYINGEFRQDDSVLERRSPLDPDLRYQVACGRESLVDEAVKAASRAQRMWAAIPVTERADSLSKCAEWLVERYGEAGAPSELKQRISSAMGKPLPEADIEVIETSDFIRYFSKIAPEILAPSELELDPELWASKRSLVEYDPYGVVAIIKPWNYPLEMIAWAAFPAMLAGNSVVIKPSEKSADVALVYAEMFSDVGLPPGVLNILQGDGETGRLLVGHGLVNYVSFTGSARVGKEIASKCAERMIKCSLELGGNDAAIVLADADVELAANGLVWGAFCDAGQVCVGVKRAFVQEGLVEGFLDRIRRRVEELRPLVDVGPIVDETQYESVSQFVDDAVNRGATAFRGAEHENPLYFPPVILTGLDPDSRLLKEECFGPVLPIIPFAHVEEAVELANESDFGLGASIWTADRDTGRALARRLQVGMVWINDVNVAFPQAPWSGVKQSGLGSELGSDAVRQFARPKSICDETSTETRRSWWYPY